jgi:putative ABC transport system substrate-binding protein
MRRRKFITLIGGAMASWPLAARAQTPDRMRRIGVLMNRATNDPAGPVRIAAFLQGMQQLGWVVGRNMRIDYRWGAADPDRYRTYAAELVALAPDVVLAPTTSTVRALLQATGNVPIVFAAATDPVGGGIVASLARPGGNVTGFLSREFSLSAKCLELLKELVPRLSRAAVLRDSTTTGGVGQFSAIQTAAPALGVELTPIDVRDAGEIERGIAGFARHANSGLIMTASARADLHRELIIALVARHRLPAVYFDRDCVTGGGLISYAADMIDQYRRAAG